MKHIKERGNHMKSMKKLGILSLALIMTATAAVPATSAMAAGKTLTSGAAKTIAAKYAPKNAQYISTERDDGVYEVTFLDKSKNEKHELDISISTKKLVQYSTDKIGKSGSNKVKLSTSQAKAVVLKEIPKATITSVVLDKDDYIKDYDVKFKTSSYTGSMEINPETGLVLEREFKIAKPKSTDKNLLSQADIKKILLKKVPNATIIELTLDTDDGRKVYEGEMIKNGVSYEFEIDAYTGTILGWDID